MHLLHQPGPRAKAQLQQLPAPCRRSGSGQSLQGPKEAFFQTLSLGGRWGREISEAKNDDGNAGVRPGVAASEPPAGLYRG